MAWERIIVEDGTIVANANSYIGEDDYNAYVIKVGFSDADYTDDEIQTAVIKACEYLNSLEYIGFRSFDRKFEEMQFPRRLYYSDTGDTIPPVLKTAQLWLVLKLLGDPELQLYRDNSSGRDIQTETVGPITTTYFASDVSGEPKTIRFDYIDGILKNLVLVGDIKIG